MKHTAGNIIYTRKQKTELRVYRIPPQNMFSHRRKKWSSSEDKVNKHLCQTTGDMLKKNLENLGIKTQNPKTNVTISCIYYAQQ